MAEGKVEPPPTDVEGKTFSFGNARIAFKHVFIAGLLIGLVLGIIGVVVDVNAPEIRRKFRLGHDAFDVPGYDHSRAAKWYLAAFVVWIITLLSSLGVRFFMQGPRPIGSDRPDPRIQW